MSYSLLGVNSNMAERLKNARGFPMTARETTFVLQFSYGNEHNQSILGHS